jgi:hypothetical protein
MTEKYSKDDPTYQILSKTVNPLPSENFNFDVMQQIRIEAAKKQISYSPLISKKGWAIIVIVFTGLILMGLNLDLTVSTFNMDKFLNSFLNKIPFVQFPSWVGLTVILLFGAVLVNIVIENINIRKSRSSIPIF